MQSVGDALLRREDESLKRRATAADCAHSRLCDRLAGKVSPNAWKLSPKSPREDIGEVLIDVQCVRAPRPAKEPCPQCGMSRWRAPCPVWAAARTEMSPASTCPHL